MNGILGVCDCRQQNFSLNPICIFQLFFGYLARLLCLKKPEELRDMSYDKPPSKPVQDLALSKNGGQLKGDSPGDDHVISDVSKMGNPEKRHPLDLGTREVCKALLEYVTRGEFDEEEDQKRDVMNAEWKFLALILDRVALLVYFVIIVIGLVILFPRPA